MSYTKISWTERTWNPSTGCTKISAGCLNCYASSLAVRLKSMGVNKYRNGFNLTFHSNEILTPFAWKRPSVIFVNSMSDLFHEEMPVEYIERVFNTMNKCERHIFQVLTKRAKRMRDICRGFKIKDNIWLGVTVENSQNKFRADLLREVHAKVKFLSIEPMLESLPKLNLEKINWVIVGGESGPKARPIQKDWVEDIQRQCKENGVQFFFKQWGGFNKKQNGNLLNGKRYEEYPSEYIAWQKMLNDQYRSGELFQ